MGPFLGSEALASGAVTRGAMRWNYTAIHPDVYVPRGVEPDLYTRTTAAWLWTGRTGVIAGRAGAALYGVPWIPRTIPVELIAKSRKPQSGVITRYERLAVDERRHVGPLPVTTPARTAFDLGRHLDRRDAIAYVDAVARLTGVTAAEITAVAEGHPGVRGLRQLWDVVRLMDGGAATPEETWLRMVLRDAGLPRPRTDIVVREGMAETRIALGWNRALVGVDFDDVIEETNDPFLAEQRIRRTELLQRCGWYVIRVRPGTPPYSIVFRVRDALRRRAK
jgi:hypothetical protein